MDSIRLAQDEVQWRTLVSRLMKFPSSIEAENLLTGWTQTRTLFTGHNFSEGFKRWSIWLSAPYFRDFIFYERHTLKFWPSPVPFALQTTNKQKQIRYDSSIFRDITPCRTSNPTNQKDTSFMSTVLVPLVPLLWGFNTLPRFEWCKRWSPLSFRHKTLFSSCHMFP
jgi:hypothetical protein